MFYHMYMRCSKGVKRGERMLSLVVDITDRATIPNHISAAINKTLSEH